MRVFLDTNTLLSAALFPGGLAAAASPLRLVACLYTNIPDTTR
ncbi:MAG: hypothetical protein ACFN02_01705 [Olsenella profusa]